MKKYLLTLLLLTGSPLPLAAQMIPKAELTLKTSPGADDVVRVAVIRQWKLPRLKQDTTVEVQANLLADGSLANAKITLQGVEGEDRDETRISLEKALARTQLVGQSPGPILFTVALRSGARYSNCYPLKLYIPERTEDSREPIEPKLVTALQQGAIKWNAMAVGYGEGKVVPPFVFTDNPTEANVRIEAYEDHPGYSSYLIDEAAGQTILRMPVKQLRSGLISSGFRWWKQEPVTQMTMFQLGRLLGLNLSEEPTSVLYPGVSRYVAAVKTEASSTKAVSTTLVGYGDPLEDDGIGDRTLTSFQLDDVTDQLRRRACNGVNPATYSPQGTSAGP